MRLNKYITPNNGQLIVEAYYLEEGNLHMEHFEDNVINKGPSGLDQDIKIIRSILDRLSGNSGGAKLTTKWDGAPSTVFGYDKNGKFFVSTKSAFNKTPKLAYTNQDVDDLFGSPGLKEKLKDCLQYLPEVVDSGVYQGDLMFTGDDKKNQVINGEKVISFTPNTITYTVPNDDSDLAKEIRKAKVGIVIHTQYIGGNFDRISFNVNKDMFSKSPNVWVQDAVLADASGKVNLEPKEINDIEIKTIELEDIAGKLTPDVFAKMKRLGLDTIYKIWTNSTVRNRTMARDPEDQIQSFIKFAKDYVQREIDALKTEKAKQIKKSILTSFLEFFKKFYKQLVLMANAGIILTYIKQVIINKLNQIKTLGTFIQRGNSFEVTSPEGFCVVDNDGSVLKLVSRMEFSSLNLNNPKFKK
jgi:hypothetical protein